MNSFALSLLDSRGSRHFDAITHFIGADASGSFGVMAGHAHMLVLLRYGRLMNGIGISAMAPFRPRPIRRTLTPVRVPTRYRCT